MKSRFQIVILIVSVALSLFSCGDDNCTTCSGTEQKAALSALAAVSEGELMFMGYLTSLDGSRPAIDSITLGGWAAIIRHSIGISLSTVQLNRETTTYRTGDSIQVKIFTPTGICTSDIRLLDIHWDAPTIFNHPSEAPYDTIGLREDILVSWDESPRADCYGISVEYRYDSSGITVQRTDLHTRYESPLTISGSDLPYNGDVGISVIALTGPAPSDTGGNIIGDVVNGVINGYAVSERIRIYVGTGDATPSPADDSAPWTDRELLNILNDQ